MDFEVRPLTTDTWGDLEELVGQPAGWISLGPRGDYAKLARSRVMKPVDDATTG